jgi:hypothetical protein
METTLNITRRYSMKKYLLGSAFFFALVAFSGTAIAAGYGDGGCGPGSLVIGTKRDGGQLLAATTNGIGVAHSSAITFGTSNSNRSVRRLPASTTTAWLRKWPPAKAKISITWPVCTVVPGIPTGISEP